MSSYFNLTLDTLAPQNLTIAINDSAAYASSASAHLDISVSDADTTGYQMLIWGISGIETEGAASWESYSITKNITLITGDGLKTVYIKVRDDVGNTTSAASDTITLDTTAPAVTVSSGPDVSRISKVASYTTCAFGWTSDSDFVEYKIKVVPATDSIHSAGTQIPVTAGSTYMSGTGTFPASTPINSTIKGADLETASSGDGTKIVKVFVKDASGAWSAA